MKRDYRSDISEDDMARIVREAFGVDDDRNFRDFLRAQTEISEDMIPPEPEDGFEQFLKKVKERQIEPKYIKNDFNPEKTEMDAVPAGDVCRGYPRRLQKCTIKAMLLAAILAAVVLGVGITVDSGKQQDYYISKSEDAGRFPGTMYRRMVE